MEKEKLVKIIILAFPLIIILALLIFFNINTKSQISGQSVSEPVEEVEEVKEATCDDGIWNGDESDMDCGGSCPGCLSSGVYIACWDASDCQSEICDIAKATRPLPQDHTIEILRKLAGDSSIITYQGTCK